MGGKNIGDSGDGVLKALGRPFVFQAKDIFNKMYPDCEFLPRAPDPEEIILDDDEQSKAADGAAEASADGETTAAEPQWIPTGPYVPVYSLHAALLPPTCLSALQLQYCFLSTYANMPKKIKTHTHTHTKSY